jgi:Transposase IS116/IS110/IS902 family
VKALAWRRVTNDFRDAADLADLLRLGRLPEAWIARRRCGICGSWSAIAPSWSRSARRGSARCTRSWPPAGSRLGMSDLFGQAGTQLLDHLQLPTTFAARVNWLRRLLDPLDAEIALFSSMVAARLARHPGYRAIQHIDGLGPALAAVLVAETGDVTRFPGPTQLASWVGLTPRHHEPDAHVHCGKITKQGSRLHRLGSHRSGAAHRPADPAGDGPRTGRRTPWPQHRRGRRGPRACLPGLLRAARRPHSPPGCGSMTLPHACGRALTPPP